MKMNKAWLRIAGLVLLSVITSGCMTTKAVTVAGKRMEYLNSDILAKDSVIVAEDGAIAVKARFGIAAGNGNPIFRCNKYVIASRSGVESSIYRTKTWREYDSHPRLTNPGQQYPPTIQISADCCGNKVWEVVPDGISRENMALEKIPPNFRKNASTFAMGQTIPYVIMGKNIHLQVIPGTHMRRDYREWWGYPAQVLVPPAFIIDLMWCPFWEATIGEHHEFIHYEPPWEAF